MHSTDFNAKIKTVWLQALDGVPDADAIATRMATTNLGMAMGERIVFDDGAVDPRSTGDNMRGWRARRVAL